MYFPVGDVGDVVMWLPVRLGLGPAPGDVDLNRVVILSPGDAAVNDVVSCQVR